MKIQVNLQGVKINQYLMKAALPLGLYFIIEYLVRNFAASNIMLNLLNLPMMFVTPIIMYIIVRKLRDQYLNGAIAGFYAWTFGVQLMFFAGLIEAAFVYVYNGFINPTNLMTVHDQLIAQYDGVLAELKAMPNAASWITSVTDTLSTSIDQLKEAPVMSAIETAMTMLSNDIFYGMLIMIILAPIIKKRPTSTEEQE